MTDYAFATLDICRLEAGVFAGNPASARVLEKAGYVLKGALPAGRHQGRAHRRPPLAAQAVRTSLGEADFLGAERPRAAVTWRAGALARRQLGTQAVTVISISRSGEFSVATVTVVRAGLSLGKYFPYSSLYAARSCTRVR